MPIGNIIHILGSGASIGSMANLYESIETLDDIYFNTEACKTMLLNPINASRSHYSQLVLKVDEDACQNTLFTCQKSKCATNECPFYSSVKDTRCRCGVKMDFESYWTSKSWKENDGDGIFVKGMMKFLVTDDLHVMPSSTAAIKTILEINKIKDLENIVEAYIRLDQDNIRSLLKRCLVSKSPLSDFYLSVTNSIEDTKLESKFNFLPKIEVDTDPKKMKAKFIRSKSSNTIIYAEVAGEGLVDLLFSFLTFPVGAIIKRLGKSSTLGSCVDNLYTGVENLSMNTDYTKSERCKSKLLDPKLATYFGCNSLPLSIDEEPSYNIKLSGCDICYAANINISASTECEHGIKHALLRAMNPKLVSPSTDVGGGYAKKEIKFMITDDLEVTPFSSFTGRRTVKAHKIDFTDLEEKEIEIGEYEALNLLKACLTSVNPLTAVFGALDKWEENVIN